MEVSTPALDILDAHFVVAVPLAAIHHDPDPTSELLTQALMNTPALAGDSAGAWTHVTLPGHAGWIRTAELEEPITRGYCSKEEGVCGIALPYSVVVTSPLAPLYNSEQGEEVLMQLYRATVLPYIDLAHPQRLRVALPGDREGWLSRIDAEVRSNFDLTSARNL